MIDEFNRTHSDVVVSKDSGGVNSDRMLQKVTAGLQADNYPDIAYIYGSDLANLAKGDQLLDLSDAIDNGDINWDRFVDAGKQAGHRRRPAARDPGASSTTWPWSTTRRSSTTPASPTRPTTGRWDDFLKTAAELNDPDAGSSGFGWPGTGDEDTTWRIWPLVWQQGGDIVNEDGDSVGFDGASGEAALNVVAQAAADGSVYIDSTAGSERMQQLFVSGKMAMNIAGPYSLPEYVDARSTTAWSRCRRSATSTRRSPGPTPGRSSTTATSATQAALEFMDWFTEPEQQLRWISEAGQPAADQRRQGRRRLRRLREEPAGPRQVHREHRPGPDPRDDPRVPADLAGDGQGGRLGALRGGRARARR